MNKTKIEYVDLTWNPIRGPCPIKCSLPDGRVYCYALRYDRRFCRYKRWRHVVDKVKCGTRNVYLTMDPNVQTKLDYWTKRKEKKKIFVCSTFELFLPTLSGHWRQAIFDVISKNPFHTFIILTKRPQYIDRKLPRNVWIGTTITRPSEMWRMTELFDKYAQIKFASFEPILEDFDDLQLIKAMKYFRWVILGKLTQCGKLYDPKEDLIRAFFRACRMNYVPIFMKDNLKEICKGHLIQEFPE